MTAHILGVLALIAVALLLGAAWYEAVVMAPNYQRDIPESLVLARQFLARTTPAHFFRVVAPAAQLLALLAVIFDWQNADALRRAAREWAAGNWVRGVLLFVVFFAFLAGTIHLATHLHA